jgi:iron complex outermembrane receptor protein
MHLISLAAALAILPGTAVPNPVKPPSAMVQPPAAREHPGDLFTIGGRVTDSAGTPIYQARVQLIELSRITATDDSGRYYFAGVAPGTYRLSVAAIGFRSRVEVVSVANNDVTLPLALKRSLVELPTIQVTASANATDPLTSPQPTAVVSGADLANSQAASLGETLNQVAGVHSLGTGPGIGKPVIRGLTSNRVLVLDNGQRMETQQWGDEHGPNVETENADRIEVIRGPASVLYGSDALGGVVNIIQRPLPDALGRSAFVRGTVSGSYSTNNQEPDGALLLEGASGGFGFRVNGSGRKSDNLKTPNFELWNSANRAIGGSGTLGYRGAWGSLSGTYTQRNETIHLTDEDPLAEPTQRIGTNRARVNLEFPAGASRVEATVGYERSRRREFEDPTTSTVALGLLSQDYTADLHFHHAPIGRMSGILGLTGQRTTFEKFGEETLIPGTKVNNLAAFAFEQIDAGRWNFSFGGRFDYRHMDVDQDTVIGVSAQTRKWNSVTGNVGVLFKLAEPAALVLNIGRGFRAPSSFDLFSNGVHEGTVAFERGDSTLKTEKSINTDLALRVQTENLAVELGGFVNWIQDFIYSIPTGQTDPGSGFEIFDVTQGDARLNGIELAGQYHPTPFLHLQGTVDYVRGTNTSTGNPLPNIPPFRATYFVRLEGGQKGWLQDPYFLVGGETNARQTRLDPAEAQFFAQAFGGAGFQSKSYTLANMGAGFGIPAGRTTVHLDFQVKNLFDKAYSDFLSRIKTNARDPGMGRTFVAKVSTDF